MDTESCKRLIRTWALLTPIPPALTGSSEVDGTYYMIGEDKTQGTVFQNVNCYSSKNLVEWTYEGALLSQTQEAGDLGPDRVVERPKVLFNDNTGKYVLYLHIDSRDYKEAKVGVATGDTVCGKYEYHGSFRPLGFQSRDMGLFKDEDGSGYLLSEDVSDAAFFFCHFGKFLTVFLAGLWNSYYSPVG